jgi:hypothetical protein
MAQGLQRRMIISDPYRRHSKHGWKRSEHRIMTPLEQRGISPGVRRQRNKNSLPWRNASASRLYPWSSWLIQFTNQLYQIAPPHKGTVLQVLDSPSVGLPIRSGTTNTKCTSSVPVLDSSSGHQDRRGRRVCNPFRHITFSNRKIHGFVIWRPTRDLLRI